MPNLPTAGSRDDRTGQQVHAQLDAWGAPAYEIGLIPPRHRTDLKPERTRRFTAAQVLESIRWLKFMNLSDRNVFCRAAALADGRLVPMVFVDDLCAQQVDHMEDAGLPFGILIESSPTRFHGWVRVASEAISRTEAQTLARELASRFGGDLGAAAWNQYGRLAGFTNRKRERVTVSGAPFAILRAASKDVAPEGARMLGEIRERLIRSPEETMKAKVRSIDLPPGGAAGTAIVAFSNARDRVRAVRPDGNPDDSRKDFGAACALVEQGYPLAEIEWAIIAGSPQIYVRHPDAADYARRTAYAAWHRASR